MNPTVNNWLIVFCALSTCVLTYESTTPSARKATNGFKVAENAEKEPASERSSIRNPSAYIRASIPDRIFQCVGKLPLIRCIKLFLLQRMEGGPNFRNTGNLTKDFLDQFVYNDHNFPSLFDKKYAKYTDVELNRKLLRNMKLFFKGRDIKLHFLPGVLLQVLPNTEDKIHVSFKKDASEHRSRKAYKKMIQMAVPVMLMPAILLGSFLPFMIPAIKMAAIMSTMVNNGALLAAVIYAARTAAMNSEQPVHYSYPGYH